MAMNWRTILESALVSGVVAAFISIGGSYLIGMRLNDRVVERTAQLEEIARFNQSTGGLEKGAAAMIAAMTDRKDLASAKVDFRTQIAQELAGSANLSRTFGHKVKPALTDYENALETLAASLDKTEGPITAKVWIESLGAVFDARSRLNDSLYVEAGMGDTHSSSSGL